VNIRDAIYHAVQRYPGGAESLAPRMGMSGSDLRNRTNPNCERAGLRADSHLPQLIELTGGDCIVQALAAQRGYGLHRLDCTQPGPCSPLAQLAHTAAHCGDVARELAMAMADGAVSPNEYARVASTIRQAMADLVALDSVTRACMAVPPQERH
jgi:hypothetical protein